MIPWTKALDHVEAGRITVEAAIEKALDKMDFRKRMATVRARRRPACAAASAKNHPSAGKRSQSAVEIGEPYEPGEGRARRASARRWLRVGRSEL